MHYLSFSKERHMIFKHAYSNNLLTLDDTLLTLTLLKREALSLHNSNFDIPHNLLMSFDTNPLQPFKAKMI